MRIRIVRMFCQENNRVVLVVQKWGECQRVNDEKLLTHWESVKDFELNEYDIACAYAMDLSMAKRTVTEVAVFEDGAIFEAGVGGGMSDTSVDSVQTQ